MSINLAKVASIIALTGMFSVSGIAQEAPKNPKTAPVKESGEKAKPKKTGQNAQKKPRPAPPEKKQVSNPNENPAWAGIVRVENSAISPDYGTPWNGGRPSGGSGTGFLVGENLFMTNAHVVSNANRLTIRQVGNPAPLAAELLHIAHDCDLALLRLVDPSPFAGVKPLPVGEIPALDTEVTVVGYPIGGERMSVTRGVVSRIDFNSYSHSGVDQHLTIQIDAAINPGNSGGPVLQDGKVVGVAFQGYSGAVAQNVGYMIPTPVIERLLTDIEDGRYDHYVDLALSDFPIQNPAQIKALKLPEPDKGVLVSWVDQSGSSADVVKVGDVLLEIDGSPVASNGLIRVDGELVNLNEIVERKFAGDQIKVKLWRNGKELVKTVKLKRYLPYLIAANAYDKRPTYTVYAGLLFQPLERNLMAAHGIEDQTVQYWFNYYGTDELYLERPEPVVFTQVLPDAINTHIKSYIHSIVDTIDGKTIETLRDAHEALTAKSDEEFIVIKLLATGRPIVLDRAEAAKAHRRILDTYNIPEDHFLGEAVEGDVAAK